MNLRNIFTIFFASTVIAQLLPIPKIPLGLKVTNPANASVFIESFHDLLCPDAKADFAALSSVLLSDDNRYSKKVQWKIYLSALPYHPHAHAAHKVAWSLQKSPSRFLAYANQVFQNQILVFDPSKTEFQIWDLLVGWGIDVLKTDGSTTPEQEDAIKRSVKIGSKEDVAVRTQWKYGASRGVFGTPTTFINGVFLKNTRQSKEEWINLLDYLLPTNQNLEDADEL